LSEVLNFTYFDVYWFPFPSRRRMAEVVLISHPHRDHLPDPRQVEDKIVVCPNGVNCRLYQEGAEVRYVALYRRAALPNGRHVVYVAGGHGNYIVLLWREKAYLYIGDLNYDEDERILNWLNKLLEVYVDVTLILPIYGGISSREAKRRHHIPEDADPNALANKVSAIAKMAREKGVKRILGIPHPLFHADWADEVAEKVFKSLEEVSREKTLGSR